MSKKLIAIIGAAVLLVIFGVSTYNSLVDKDEEVKLKWSNLEAQYQRRADLIPNLVNTVKGYVQHERETLEAVMEARSKATSITVDPSNITPEQFAEYQKAQSGVTSALGRLLAVAENYPDLKANQQFLELQAQLEGTENRIEVAREDYNKASKSFNSSVRKFPTNLFASIFGFEMYDYYEAEEGAEIAPQVQF
ncbi:MAG: LemA family protein [Paludibacteraceae bacterium]|nr:LemA family protein [Bacteroidales bacterium]MBO5131991.1 LemA family protein [Paludibacteraceae bacterium]MBR6659551.1 LemA family protein [Paludibacteraceae bacterium]